MSEAKARELLAEIGACPSYDTDTDVKLMRVPLLLGMRLRAYLAAVPAPPAGPSDAQREIAAEYAECLAGDFLLTPQMILDAWRAINNAAPAAPPAGPTLTTLAERINEIAAKHGSLRAAARVIQIDHAYLWRLAHGEKDNPDLALLRKLGLRQVVLYERADAAPAAEPVAQPYVAGAISDNARKGGQAEAPAADRMLRELELLARASNSVAHKSMLRAAAARIESDAERIRELEAQAKREDIAYRDLAHFSEAAPMVSAGMKPIPITAAKRIANEYGYDQVVIVARKVGGGEHCTTYGVDRANCEVAARIGDFFKHGLMKWPRRSDSAASPTGGEG